MMSVQSASDSVVFCGQSAAAVPAGHVGSPGVDWSSWCGTPAMAA